MRAWSMNGRDELGGVVKQKRRGHNSECGGGLKGGKRGGVGGVRGRGRSALTSPTGGRGAARR